MNHPNDLLLELQNALSHSLGSSKCVPDIIHLLYEQFQPKGLGCLVTCWATSLTHSFHGSNGLNKFWPICFLFFNPSHLIFTRLGGYGSELPPLTATSFVILNDQLEDVLTKSSKGPRVRYICYKLEHYDMYIQLEGDCIVWFTCIRNLVRDLFCNCILTKMHTL